MGLKAGRNAEPAIAEESGESTRSPIAISISTPKRTAPLGCPFPYGLMPMRGQERSEGAAGFKPADNPIDGKRMDLSSRSSAHICPCEQGAVDRFLRRIRCGTEAFGDERSVFADDLHGKQILLRIMGRQHAVAEGDDDIAAAVVGDRAGPSQPEGSALRHPLQLPRIERQIGRNHDDDRAILLAVVSLVPGQKLSDWLAQNGEVDAAAEVGQDENADMVFAARRSDGSRRGPDSSLPAKAHHAGAGSDGAFSDRSPLLPGFLGQTNRFNRMFRPDMQAAHVVQITVVAFARYDVDGAGLSADSVILLHHVAQRAFSRSGHAERIGQHDRSLQRAELVDLDKPGRFAEAVDDIGCRSGLLPEQISLMRQNSGDSRPYDRLIISFGQQRDMARAHSRDIRDAVERSRFHPADLQSIFMKPPPVHSRHSFVLVGKSLASNLDISSGVFLRVPRSRTTRLSRTPHSLCTSGGCNRDRTAGSDLSRSSPLH
ncbi:hypothetical protein BN871_CV_00480 [Paenibacillus sp. P22]|nr:hypothetical protein BN871_CV_00480 [Paenibacillus sp. P22]